MVDTCPRFIDVQCSVVLLYILRADGKTLDTYLYIYRATCLISTSIPRYVCSSVYMQCGTDYIIIVAATYSNLPNLPHRIKLILKNETYNESAKTKGVSLCNKISSAARLCLIQSS